MASVAFERDEMADGNATPNQRRFPRRAFDNRLAMKTGKPSPSIDLSVNRAIT